MSATSLDLLHELSASLAARVAAGAPLVVALGAGHRPRTGLLWRADAIVASEQSLAEHDRFTVTLPGGATAEARLAGRDRGTNVAALRLDPPAPFTAPPRAAEPQVGALVLALGADASGGATARLGLVRLLGPAWHSQAGGRIDRLIGLDMALSAGEEGGPVLDAAGALLGISTLGPRRRVLVIPCATIERVLEPLLSHGRVERGWLGVGVQPVALPDELRAATGREVGLMVMSLVQGAPAALAGVMQGDILLELNGQPVAHRRAIAAALHESRVGQVVTLGVLRAGVAQTLSATIAARPPR